MNSDKKRKKETSFLYHYDIIWSFPLCATPPSYPGAFLIIKKKKKGVKRTSGLIIITITIIIATYYYCMFPRYFI